VIASLVPEDISQALRSVGMSTNAEISAAWIERANTMARVVVPLQPTRKLLRDKNTSARLQLRALKPTCPARDSLESQIPALHLI
jgi:hypothetical protein